MSMPWPQRPVIYEINTWVWLNDLNWLGGESVTLATVPASQWDAIAALGVDAVWLMGVWQRSPAGIRVANANLDLQADFRRALPGRQLAARTLDAAAGQPQPRAAHLRPAQLALAEPQAFDAHQRPAGLRIRQFDGHAARRAEWVFDRLDRERQHLGLRCRAGVRRRGEGRPGGKRKTAEEWRPRGHQAGNTPVDR